MKIEHKSIAFELKLDGDTGRIKGFGSVYGNVDNGNDIVMPGAFAKCITRMKANAKKPKMLWQHKTDMPIGVWDIFDESANGLIVEGNIFTETSMGKDAYALVKGGAINGLSIGYGVRDYSIDAKSGTRLLKELELYEVSLVTFPMNEMATITSVKSVSGDIDTAVSLLKGALAMCEGDMTDEARQGMLQMLQTAIGMLDEPDEEEDMKGDLPMTERQLEKSLREVGFSQRQAKGLIAGGYKAIAGQRDADEQQAFAELSASIDKTINLLKGINV